MRTKEEIAVDLMQGADKHISGFWSQSPKVIAAAICCSVASEISRLEQQIEEHSKEINELKHQLDEANGYKD